MMMEGQAALIGRSRCGIAGHFGVPTIMLSGDTAACRELMELVPKAECAEVKTGVSRTAAVMLRPRGSLRSDY
jgi:D-aminopeptidase